MSFKTVKSYNEEKFGGLFMLRNDGEYADVIFMYQDMDDVLVADTHYIKSAEYSGYVHCCGSGCPACSKNIRVQTKLFIPLYNIDAGEIQFFDRTMRFEPQLHQDVFSKFPNPSEFVFRITRHGAAGDINTTYEIVPIGKNTVKSYSQILAENNTTFPEFYNNICRDIPAAQLYNMLNVSTNFSESNEYASMPNYQVTPRVVGTSAQPVIPESFTTADIPTTDIAVPEDTTDVDELECLDDNVTF